MRKTAGDLKKGDFILYQGDIWQVQKTEFNFQGRGMATVRTKIKSVASGKNIDVTYKSPEAIETADVESVEMQFLYKDQDSLHFMNERTYNQYEVPINMAGEIAGFLKEGAKYYVFMYNDKPISMRPPASVRLKVVETEDAARGDTVSGGRKPATLETGIVVMVPLFIKKQDVIVVNPEKKEYVERVKS
jgi:elongation factor P